MRHNMVCSSPDCDFSKSNPIDEGVENFCPMCGSKMLCSCPHCDRPLRNRGPVCSECGKKLKKEPKPAPRKQGKT